ncbi:hypothetical protein L208DRAFT_1302667 [Tricholoma matsutake]|nr:hypothetical protein L208DRAFT_1302667 [Tricholoma matsutake 945]
MSGSDDEFSSFDFSEFTKNDFKQIDAGLIPHNPKGGPDIIVAVEPSPEPPEGTSESVISSKQPSPYQRFRRGGFLSVTDLASLAWCEVQFDYGLRQRRSRPIASRPTSFVSAQGKEISVNQSIVMKNDHITKQGKAIHKKLEREIRFEELPVEITSDEERWALRLVNMLASLKCMMEDGLTREMPVFGVIQDQVVVGIIVCIFLPSKSLSITSNNGLAELDCPCMPSLDTSSSSHKHPRYTLQLRDAKTRRSNYLPSHEDTLPSRIQLMLYYRLLKDLISSSPAFDFDYLWKRLKLKSSEVFSTKFLVQAGLIAETESFHMVCLDDLARAWTDLVQQLGVCEVDPSLEIIYRSRPGSPKQKHKNKGEVKAQEPILTQEDLDLARAIEASLSDQRCGSSQDVGLGAVSAGMSQGSSPQRIDHNSSLIVSNGEGNDNRSDKDLTPDDMPVIGTKTFAYDDTLLNEYVAHALEWWYGHRNPRGVSVNESGRCFSCEYKSSCEWREQKASEFRSR